MSSLTDCKITYNTSYINWDTLKGTYICYIFVDDPHRLVYNHLGQDTFFLDFRSKQTDTYFQFITNLIRAIYV